MPIKKQYFLLLVISCCGMQHLSAQLLKLWYAAPAVKWTEALPLGNGRIGAMVFGGIEQEHLQFNEETLWTGGPRDYNRKAAWPYLDSIRQLLFAGKQKEAEQMAEDHFMGLKSDEGKRSDWVNKIRSLNGLKGDPTRADFDDSQWKTLQVPAYDGWETRGLEGLDGAVWLRTYFVLPEDWTPTNMLLDLNRIRDQDFTYVNGQQVGSMESAEPRKYMIAKENLHAGKNNIAVLVLNFTDKGGILGYKDTARHIAVYPEGKEDARLSINGGWKYFVQSDEPPAVAHYQADYQPFGDLWLNFTNTGSATEYKRELDLSTAIATTYYSVGDINYKREYFVSQPNQLIVVRLSASKKASISFEALLSSPHKYASVIKLNDNSLSLSLKVKDGVMKGQAYLQVNAVNGKLQVQDNKIMVNNADEVVLYLPAGTNYKTYADVSADPAIPCINALKSTAGKTYEQIKAAHIKEYQQYFNTFSIAFGKADSAILPTDERIATFAHSGDPSLVALYVQYGRYLLIASSRPGTEPANLQGIWNDLLTPPWGSKYTTNINAEMNYWPAELLNLSALHEPLFKMMEELSVTGRETARQYYHAPGWVLHHNTDQWRGTAAINASNHGIWVSGGAWLCHHLWEHYLFTQDKVFLQTRAYPIMKQAALFFNSFLIKDPASGYLISTPSNSPEEGGLVAGPTMDHQIIRDLFKNTMAAAALLGVDLPLRDTLKAKYDQIAPNRIGRYGQLQEWMQDIDDTSNKHRHVSHLWAQFPGNEINWDETPELMKAARQSLIYRGDAATGWSLGWKINFWARFKEGDHAYKLVQMLISPAGANSAGSYPNLFDAHPPFQIDGNFGGAAGIAEMLLQSHTKYIDLLPALPSALPDGTVKGLCARGGFTIDLQWHNSQLQQVKIISHAAMPLLLRYKGRTIALQTIKTGVYLFDGSLKQL